MSHYFQTPDGPDRRRLISSRIWGREIDFMTSNGVFSGSRLDPGTAVLFDHTEPPTSPGRYADVGCGFGPIALAIALACPQAEVDAVDVNERALELTALNAERLGVADRVRVLTPDQVDPDARYDQVWSNPPIRIGKPALHDLLDTWLGRLTDRGRAYLVVGRNLGADSLQRWIDDRGYDCQRIGSSKGFRVFEVEPDEEN